MFFEKGNNKDARRQIKKHGKAMLFSVRIAYSAAVFASMTLTVRPL